MRKKQQQEEDDYVQQVEERFEELNYLVSDGSMIQEMFLQLWIQAEAEQSSVDKQACDLLLRRSNYANHVMSWCHMVKANLPYRLVESK